MLLPEYGFTPKNFAELVALTGLKNSEFMTEFDIPMPTFYKYKAGDRSMCYRKWGKLFNDVMAYLEEKPVTD